MRSEDFRAANQDHRRPASGRQFRPSQNSQAVFVSAQYHDRVRLMWPVIFDQGTSCRRREGPKKNRAYQKYCKKRQQDWKTPVEPVAAIPKPQ